MSTSRASAATEPANEAFSLDTEAVLDAALDDDVEYAASSRSVASWSSKAK
jgi:hypothetical protein